MKRKMRMTHYTTQDNNMNRYNTKDDWDDEENITMGISWKVLSNDTLSGHRKGFGSILI